MGFTSHPRLSTHSSTHWDLFWSLSSNRNPARSKPPAEEPHEKLASSSHKTWSFLSLYELYTVSKDWGRTRLGLHWSCFMIRFIFYSISLKLRPVSLYHKYIPRPLRLYITEPMALVLSLYLGYAISGLRQHFYFFFFPLVPKSHLPGRSYADFFFFFFF